MSKHIDLSSLSEDELIDLNRRIVERLSSLRQHRRFVEMARFDVGDTVSFTPEGGRVLMGKVTRLNAKTVTVMTERGDRWRVSPTLLSHAIEGQAVQEAQESEELPNLIILQSKKGWGRS